ncbi:response regulator [Winogradskyella sp. A3E31]|uniref:response regulator n=1 Tax=Winogradskyella sp. A3E31 TaxID=3349637 RepID=UPI00398B6580
MNLSILIADDHPLILKGLKDYLEEQKFNVVASAKNGKEALALIRALKPDIAILDIQMPFYTGLEIAELSKQENLPTKIVLITLEKEEQYYNKALELNVFGYILKEFALDEIEHCIAAINNGKSYFSPELTDSIEAQPEAPKNISKLTAREKRILRFIAEEKTAKEIAEDLNISSRTVEKHKTNIRNRLELDSKATSLFAFAKENLKYLLEI